MESLYEMEDARFVLDMYSREDARFVLDMYSRWDVQRFLGASPKPLQTLEEASTAIHRWRSVSAQTPLLGVWAVTLRNGETVGTVMLKMAPLTSEQRPMPRSDEHEVGWHLHPGHWGHGYATEATAGALKRAFDAGVDEVVALILPGNERSVHVAERLRMQHRGLTDRYYGIEAHPLPGESLNVSAATRTGYLPQPAYLRDSGP